MTAWALLLLPLLCGGVALLELDNVHLGQWMVSRPIIVGPMLGAICGAFWLGLAGGALVELFCMDALPVGAALPVNGTIATAAFVLLCAGPRAAPAAVAFPAGLAAGSVFRRVESGVRTARGLLARRAIEEAEAGEAVRLGRVLALGMGAHAAVAALFLYAAVLALGPVLAWCWHWSPTSVRHGLDLAYRNAPWIGLGALLYSLRPRG